MTETQHTPGPWKSDSIGTIFKDGVGAIAKILPADFVGGGNAQYFEEEQNGRLIASAPELLEALEAIVSLVSRPLVSDLEVGYLHGNLPMRTANERMREKLYDIEREAKDAIIKARGN